MIELVLGKRDFDHLRVQTNTSGLRLVYGLHDIVLPYSELSVGEWLAGYGDVLAAPPLVEAFLNGRRVAFDNIPTIGDRLEFIRTWGFKGADILSGRPFRLITGDAITSLRQLPPACVSCCVTSPPYFDLRDYGHHGQYGREATLAEYLQGLVAVFREVRRVLRPNGTLWINLGDTYSKSKRQTGLAQGQLLLLPARLALAMQQDGWLLKQENVWVKPNGLPESVRNRPTRSHEVVYMFVKSLPNYYGIDDVRIPHTSKRLVRKRSEFGKSIRGQLGVRPRAEEIHLNPKGKNLRTVWQIPVSRFKGDHPATFPTDLARTCILAGCPAGEIVLDCFSGAGTTGVAALQEGRRYLGIELSTKYTQLAHERLTRELS